MDREDFLIAYVITALQKADYWNAEEIVHWAKKAWTEIQKDDE